MGAIWKIGPWVRPYVRYVIAGVTGTLVAVFVNLMIPLQTALVIDEGIAAGDSGLVKRTVLVMVGLIIAGMSASAFATTMAVRMAFNTITDLRRDLYSHTQQLSFANLDRLSSGDILTRLTSDLTKVLNILTIGLAMMTQAPIMFVGALVAIIALDASLAKVVLAMIPAIGIIVWYVIARSGALYDAVQTRIDRLNTVLAENIQGAEVVQSFVRADQQGERFDGVADELAERATVVNQLVASLMPTLTVVAGLGIAAVLWLGGNNVIAGDLSEGDLVAFLSYLVMVAMPMMMFAFLQPMVSAASASMARISEVLGEAPAIVDPAAPRELTDQPEPGDVRFENVSFHYAPDDDDTCTFIDALCNVDLHIPQGSTVAILGATGSGKSTLVHLIPRFYDPTAGTVSVGGVDVRELSLGSLRRNVAVALQTPELFSGTVMENLRYGRPDATDEEVRAAARIAAAHDFISEMAGGYDAHIEQGGSNLSGGQRQRIGIARTLVTDPAVLILDDSTSAVDLETEARIQDALATGGDRTVIIVAQRISTALGADEIVVLDDGRVAAHGTHEQLLADCAIYQEIYRSQLGEPVS